MGRRAEWRPTSFGGFSGISGAHDIQAWNGTQTSELLDGFVSGTVFTDTDAIVSKHVKGLEFAESAQTDGGLHVIGEDQEGSAERQQATMRRHAIYRRAHGVFANTERDIAPGIAPDAADRALRGRSAIFRMLEIAFAFKSGVGGRIEVGRTADDVVDALG